VGGHHGAGALAGVQASLQETVAVLLLLLLVLLLLVVVLL
jgi:hypothetical protein